MRICSMPMPAHAPRAFPGHLLASLIDALAIAVAIFHTRVCVFYFSAIFRERVVRLSMELMVKKYAAPNIPGELAVLVLNWSGIFSCR